MSHINQDENVSRLMAMMDDNQLAHLMAITGRSLRDLNEEELVDAMGVMQASNNDSTAISTTSRRATRSTPRGSSGGRQSPESYGIASRNKLRQADSVPIETHTVSPPTAASTAAASKQSAPAPPSAHVPPPSQPGRRNFLGGFRTQPKPPPSSALTAIPTPIPDFAAAIPAAIPPPPMGGLSGGPKLHQAGAPCAKCGLTEGTFLKAKDKHYHPDCFRCHFCHEKIDLHSKFAFKREEPHHNVNPGTGGQALAELHPYHAECYAIAMAKDAQCVVCDSPIPIGPDGKICFMKHPFFEKERICLKHVKSTSNAGTAGGQRYKCRRCTGCHRFEPLSAPFVDLQDCDRCVCFACCRTAIMDGSDLFPLWHRVVSFFENDMKLPVSDEFRNIPVLVVGLKELEEYQKAGGHLALSSSSSSSHIITSRGHCLMESTDKSATCEATNRLKMPAMRFNQSSSSFEAIHSQGYEYYDLPTVRETSADKSKNQVFAIMCLSGLPRDLTACILAHEAAIAWIRLNPEYDNLQKNFLRISDQVEEGVAQLITMLFMTQGGLEKLTTEADRGVFPSNEQLRQYYQFCIETDDNDIYGQGYRKAAHSYQEVGIQALMTHLVRYGTLPPV